MKQKKYPRHPDEILFEKLKYFIQPIKDLAIILDLDLYKKGITQMYVFEAKAKEYDRFLNNFMSLQNKSFVIYVWAEKKFVDMCTENFSISYDFEIKMIDEYTDFNMRPSFLSLKQQVECLIYELNHPKLEKPDC
jgi:hypothetical protein